MAKLTKRYIDSLAAPAGLVWTALQGLAVVRSGPRVFEGVLSGDLINAGQAGMGIGAGLCLLLTAKSKIPLAVRQQSRCRTKATE
jgi:hypothetical protein